MKKNWEQLINALFPTTTTTENNILQTESGFYKQTFYIGSYKQLMNVIRSNKYHHDLVAAARLGSMLDSYLAKLSDTLHIIPIPISYTRWRERGYNHIELIVKHSNHKDVLNTNTLRRSKHTKRQAHVDKKDRLRQQMNSFICNKHELGKLTGTVILLDDVVTTEATMAAARASLAPHLSPDTKLICLAIAH